MRCYNTALIVALSLAYGADAHASALSAEATQYGQKAKEVTIDQFTIYTPRTGGINGNCGGGALSKKGINICQQLLEEYIKDEKRGYVAGAVPCQGSNAANAFGGMYEATGMKGKVPGFQGDKFFIGAVDHYKCGGHGQGGKAVSDYTNHMDIAAVSENGKEAQAFATSKNTKLNWYSTFDEFRAKRQTDRIDQGAGMDRASIDEQSDSLLAEIGILDENPVYDRLTEDRIAHLEGRDLLGSRRLLAYAGDLPWVIVSRKKHRFA